MYANSINFSNIISTCQQKYKEVSAIEIKDHYYLIATGVSTVAFAAFQLYAPITCGLCTIVLTTLNAHQFGKAISETSIDKSGHLKKWMMVSCLVTSSVLGVYAIQSLPLFVSGMQSLLTLEASWSVFCFTIATGALGFGLPAAKAIYSRGLELFKTEKWEAMENYLSHKFKDKQSMHLNDRVALFILIMMPELATSQLFLGYISSAFYFLPEVEQDSFFDAFLKKFESEGNKKQYFQLCLQPFFLSLSESLKTKYYPHLVNLDNNNRNTLFTSDFKTELPLSYIISYGKKYNEIQAQYKKLLNESQQELNEMTQEIGKIPEPKRNKPLSDRDSQTLNALKEQSSLLRERLKNFISDCQLYCPNESRSGYTKFYTDLLSGNFQKTLQKLISLQASVASKTDAELLDLDETIGNYILMNYSNEDRLGGMALFASVAKRFNVGPQDLDGLENALKPLGIETVGKFIDVVFSGQKQDLNNSKLLLEKLDAYLKPKIEPQKDFRARMYTALSGVKALSSHSSQMMNIASKVTYRAVMILSTVAPIVCQPEVFAITFSGTVVCNLTYALAGHLIPKKVQSCWDWIKGDSQIKAIIMAVRLASRRPFLNLFSPLGYIDYETHTYLGADFFAKMRILSMELFYGTLVSYFCVGNVANPVSIGGFIAGIAVGNEATVLIQKTWKKISA